ncbi:L-histidine N(alpha)-methyltransferase [Streptomyces sp. NPDC086182]|uniref:L-histidine N(alpha)-methyltransferase n=1 Tax=Streptomyces sp. NPDC086182 TaxID=3155058 RepID=UPI003419C43E
MSPLNVTLTPPADATATALPAAVRHGLAHLPRMLLPKRAHGSRLPKQSIALPGSYHWCAERGILALWAPDLAAATGARGAVESRSGSSDKGHDLLNARLQPHAYFSGHVCGSALKQADAALRGQPELTVLAPIAALTVPFTFRRRPEPGLSPCWTVRPTACCPPERAAFPASKRSLLEPRAPCSAPASAQNETSPQRRPRRGRKNGVRARRRKAAGPNELDCPRGGSGRQLTSGRRWSGRRSPSPGLSAGGRGRFHRPHCVSRPLSDQPCPIDHRVDHHVWIGV